MVRRRKNSGSGAIAKKLDHLKLQNSKNFANLNYCNLEISYTFLFMSNDQLLYSQVNTNKGLPYLSDSDCVVNARRNSYIKAHRLPVNSFGN